MFKRCTVPKQKLIVIRHRYWRLSRMTVMYKLTRSRAHSSRNIISKALIERLLINNVKDP